jgi:hypothetical protein
MTTIDKNHFSYSQIHSSSPVQSSPNDVPGGVLERALHVQQNLAVVTQEANQEHPDLIAIERLVERCEKELIAIEHGWAKPFDNQEQMAAKEVSKELRDTVNSIVARLASEPWKTLLKEQKKWVEAGFDERVVVTDPEAIHFAVSTDLLYTILMFKNSSDVLDGREITIPIVNGKALFLVEGEYLSYEDIKERILYSEEEKKFLGWNFIHPAGFIHRDITDFSEMYPIATLKPDAYDRIAKTASQFWTEAQDEVDPGVEKKYVLQVITTGRSCISKAEILKNFENHTPEHTSSRLITPDGKVYSFGTKMRAADSKKVTTLSHILTTALSMTSVPDYEEAHSSEEKRVTSIPITKERFEAICQYVNKASKGFAFNFASQNCARFVWAQTALAGVHVNIKMGVPEFLFGMLPNLKDVPVVGRPLAQLISAISFVVRPIIDSIVAVFLYITPYPVKRLWEAVTWVIREVFKRIGAVFFNSIFFLMMGAGNTILPPDRITEGKQDPEDELSLPTSPRLLRWRDIINPDAIIAYHAYKLRLWQKKQPSSVFYTNPASGFHCVDPAKGWIPTEEVRTRTTTN